MQIPFHKAYITQNEIDAVVDTLKSGWLTMGPKTIKFEQEFTDHLISNNADSSLKSISLNSATAALHLALKAIELKRDDEVIIPTNTFVATAEVMTYFGAKPVLCDIEYDTHNIDVKKIEELITSKTKAIIPVHFAGQPCDMDEIINIANKFNLKVIEDAAHALPSYYKNKIVGDIGDITCFSFYATKTLSTGEGGMATTRDEKVAKKISINRLHGISKDVWDRYTEKGSWYYEVVDNGNKYNTTDLNAALGMEQLKKLDWMNKKRESIAIKYTNAFKNTSILTPIIRDDRKTSWHLYVIKVKNRDELFNKLREEGIGSSVHFIPIHKHPYYKEKFEYENELYPIANKVYNESLSLPIYPDMSDEEVDFVIKKVLQYAR
ncbi:MAG: DegT/DnrJ/EryC1/StrS family aminotransferase [Arcobacteraceae bacterium]|nr:DegT/DnrJ/EryC1/StrS family aminotransferase [Arcobacteraceae bacterium]